MTSSPAVTSFFPPSDTLASLGHQARTSSYDWKQARESKTDGLDTTELSRSQDRTPPKDTSTNNSARRTPNNMQKSAYNPTPLVVTQQMTVESMKNNPKSAAPREPFIVDGSPDGNTANGVHRRVNRWSYTGAEQSLGNWQQFAEDFGKLSMGDDTNDNTDDVTTPSNTHSKEALTNDASPLETSSSDSSLESSANPEGDALLISSHSRGSSTDTSASEASSRSQMLSSTLKASSFTSDLTKDRPRSFSGAISEVELKRLQNINTPEKTLDRSSPLRKDPYGADSKTLSSTPSSENVQGAMQPLFPSLATYPNGNYQAAIPTGVPQAMFQGHIAPRVDDLPVDGNMQARAYPNTALGAPFTLNPPTGPMRAQPDVSQFRQPPRPLNMFQPAMPLPAQGPPSLLSSPNNFPYAPLPNVHSHHNHLSLGNSQQIYEMMMAPVDPAINRAQQSFRGHQHSASDPASLRDAAALLLNNGIPVPGMTFAGAGVYPPMPVSTPPIFPNQFFPGASPQAQAAYAQDILGRSVPQYGANGNAQTPQANNFNNVSTSPSNSSGPSANNRKLGLYKTELCRSWEEKGSCRYGPKCQFAHGEDEIRKVARHPKYKTEICRTFWVSGSCPYGKRCCFIHTELPASGTPGAPPSATESAASPSTTDGRARSMSTNSDPNDAPVSLLARISAKRNQDAGSQSAVTPTASTPIDASSYHQFNTSRPGALRVDTKVVDTIGAASKQNKSAYPSFASNTIAALSPGPVTAGPDLGRHLNLNMLDVNQRLNTAGPQTPTNPTRPVGNTASPFGVLSSETPSSGNPTGHRHGHSRSGSASNWGSFSQRSQFGATGSYAHTPSPANDLASSASGASGWGDMNTGASRWL